MTHQCKNYQKKKNFFNYRISFLTLRFLVFFFSTVIINNRCFQANCGTAQTDYAPCISKIRANSMFKQCCQQFAPEGCHELCQYETEEVVARNLLMRVIRNSNCSLKNIAAVLFCASQNQDNRKCCEHLSMADPKLGVGNRCLRFCDPAGEGISKIARNDVTCLFNWNVLMYCHHSGIPQE
ncbi:unnamed protein product [Enterobius vermicularis]|uniref:Domain of unknown function DB domain-containing protein n=1 Tax=Enterobius vermicularis TaxID=51028 RepID=A0A3P6HPW4_ENTVE|nr:unnamed protein product [Enterobius vermicularis]